MAAETENEQLFLDLTDEDADGADAPTTDSEDGFEFDDEGKLVVDETDAGDSDEDDIDFDLDLDDSEDGSQDNPEQQDDNPEQPQTDTADDGQKQEPAQAPETSQAEKDYGALQKEYDALVGRCKAALKALGNDTDDVNGGLEQIAAEADGKTLDEYRKEVAEAERSEEARKLLQQAQFEKMIAADLDELHKCYPETHSITSITQIENFALFGRFRDQGLSVKQAYAAANPDKVRTSVATAVKQQNLNATKDHLKSAVPKQSSGEAKPRLTRKELEYYRELLGTDDDKEVVKYFQRTKS